MCYAMSLENEESRFERWHELTAPDTESVLAEASAGSPVVYAVPALAATDDRSLDLDGGFGEAGSDDGRGPERRDLDGLIVAGLV